MLTSTLPVLVTPHLVTQGDPSNDKSPAEASAKAVAEREALGRSRGGLTQCRRRGITATIPEKTDQIRHRAKRGSRGGRPPVFDPERYKQRNTAERCINKLTGFRAVATRYDKRDFMYQATIDVASIRIWLKDPVP